MDLLLVCFAYLNEVRGLSEGRLVVRQAKKLEHAKQDSHLATVGWKEWLHSQQFEQDASSSPHIDLKVIELLPEEELWSLVKRCRDSGCILLFVRLHMRCVRVPGNSKVDDFQDTVLVQ